MAGWVLRLVPGRGIGYIGYERGRATTQYALDSSLCKIDRRGPSQHMSSGRGRGRAGGGGTKAGDEEEEEERESQQE